MINKDFVLPDGIVSQYETERRLKLLPQIKELFSASCDAIFVGGSLATSQNYGVHPDSDIDTQLLITPETVDHLLTTNFFDTDTLSYYIEGYKKGLAEQFSLSGEMGGVKIECHFWDRDGYLSALHNRKQSVLRFRSSAEGSSINYGFSFRAEEQETDYPTETIEKWHLSPFPFYERTAELFFPCRPITNLLGTPIVVKGDDLLTPYVDDLWVWVIDEMQRQSNAGINSDTYNIINAMPGHWKFSPDTLEALKKRTKELLGM